jgi:CMP-N,N'-diacetyllegionaminic acid synthase
MNIIGVIPARGGSKGVHKKNIKLLGDFPLISYTIKSALKSNLSDVIVSTDCNDIADVTKQEGANLPFMRPEKFATDTASSLDVIVHALRTYEEMNNTSIDAIMMLQPTTPFRSTEDINCAIELLQNNPEADSVISVVDVGGTHPARMKYLENGYLVDPEFCEAKENQNRQELIPMYIRNGAIYLSRRETLLTRSFKGNKSMAYIMPAIRSVNIDTLSDFQYAEWQYINHLK